MSQRNADSAATVPESPAADGSDAAETDREAADRESEADNGSGSAPAARPAVTPAARHGARGSSAVLPDSSERESSRSWGDDSGGFDDDWYLSERPPHHG